MTRNIIPDLCEMYQIDIGIYDPKSKRKLPRNVKQRDVCVHIRKSHFCVFWKKKRRDSLLNGVDELEKNFNYFKNKINENNLYQRCRYRFPKLETIDQLENVILFDLETYHDQEFA